MSADKWTVTMHGDKYPQDDDANSMLFVVQVLDAAMATKNVTTMCFSAAELMRIAELISAMEPDQVEDLKQDNENFATVMDGPMIVGMLVARGNVVKFEPTVFSSKFIDGLKRRVEKMRP